MPPLMGSSGLRRPEFGQAQDALIQPTLKTPAEIPTDPETPNEPLVLVGDHITITTPDGGGFSFNPGRVFSFGGIDCLVGIPKNIFELPKRDWQPGEPIRRTHIAQGFMVAVPVNRLTSLHLQDTQLPLFVAPIHMSSLETNWQETMIQTISVQSVHIRRQSTDPLEVTWRETYEFEAVPVATQEQLGQLAVVATEENAAEIAA